MKSLVEPGARNTESQRGGRGGNGGHVVWNREIEAARVLQVVAGDDLEHQSGVHHRARHRPYVVQGPRTGYDSRGAHATVRGFESNNAAVASRLADGTSSIGADRPVTHLRRDCDRRPAGRAAWTVRNIPRIANRTEVTDGRTAAVGELVQVGLAQKHGPGGSGGANPPPGLSGDALLKKPAVCRGALPRRIHQVFEGDRD